MSHDFVKAIEYFAHRKGIENPAKAVAILDQTMPMLCAQAKLAPSKLDSFVQKNGRQGILAGHWC